MSALRNPAPAPREVPHERLATREPIRHFWKRMARAVALLMAAVATHVWLVRAPLPPPLAAAAPPVTPAASSPPSVRVAVDLVMPRITRRPMPPVELETAQRDVREAGAVAMSAFDSRASYRFAGTAGRSTATDTSPTDPQPRSDTVRSQPPTSSAAPGAPDVPVVPDLQEIPPALLAYRSTPMAMPASAGALLKPTSRLGAPRAEALDRDPQTQHVLEVLNRYRRAFETMDVRAAKAVWPTLDARRLQRAFERLDGQQVQFDECGVLIRGRDANASCRGDATYQPKVGSKPVRLTSRKWTFDLSRDEAGWQIVNAEIH